MPPLKAQPSSRISGFSSSDNATSITNDSRRSSNSAAKTGVTLVFALRKSLIRSSTSKRRVSSVFLRLSAANRSFSSLMAMILLSFTASSALWALMLSVADFPFARSLRSLFCLLDETTTVSFCFLSLPPRPTSDSNGTISNWAALSRGAFSRFHGSFSAIHGYIIYVPIIVVRSFSFHTAVMLWHIFI